VIGPYRQPVVRLPGAGGAPEIAASSREVIVIARHTSRAFVNRLDFVTSIGHHEGGDSRKALGLPGDGPTAVITDLGVLRPEPDSRELVLTAIHPGVAVTTVRERTGWPLRIAASLTETEPPTVPELDTLRRLSAGRATGSAG
ncbi:MAG TPA: CoA-transferase, partial [Actinomycetes bacterium]|nr:CoA-transferase [Actinomycetes bacterium]